MLSAQALSFQVMSPWKKRLWPLQQKVGTLWLCMARVAPHTLHSGIQWHWKTQYMAVPTMLMWLCNDIFIDDLSEFIVRWGLSEPEKVARGLWLWPGLWSFLGVPRISLLLHVDLYCVCWQFGKHDQDTGSEVCHWESSLRRSWVNGGVNAYDEACCLGFESRCIKPRLD